MPPFLPKVPMEIRKMKILSLILFCLVWAGSYAQSASTSLNEAGRKVYSKNCQSCHMPDGGGVPGLNPPLAKTVWVTGDKKKLINVVLAGLEDPITVNGEEYTNPMPPQPLLTDKEIADVLTYIRNSFGNKASAIKETEVKAQRAKLAAAKPK